MVLQMKATKKPTIFSDKSLKSEFKRVLKSASNFKATMPIQASEIAEFFSEDEYQTIKIKYSDAALRDIRKIIKAKVRIEVRFLLY